GSLENLPEKSSQLLNVKDSIAIFIGETKDELECTEYSSYCLKKLGKKVPDINFDQAIETGQLVANVVREGLIHGALPVSSGGYAKAIVESSLGSSSPKGMRVSTETNGLSAEVFLFSESASRYLLFCDKSREEEVRNVLGQHNVRVEAVGKPGGK